MLSFPPDERMRGILFTALLTARNTELKKRSWQNVDKKQDKEFFHLCRRLYGRLVLRSILRIVASLD